MIECSLSLQVHRLDKDTSGCLIVALSEQSAAAITALFRNKTAAAISSPPRDAAVGGTAERTGLQRTYWALVEGIPAQAEAVIDTPVKKVSRDTLRKFVLSLLRQGTGQLLRLRP